MTALRMKLVAAAAAAFGPFMGVAPDAASTTTGTLYGFTGAGDGGNPVGGLVVDSAGNL